MTGETSYVLYLYFISVFHTELLWAGIYLQLNCLSRMSKDVLSSTIATLNRITNNVNCCRQPELPQETESANQNKADNSQSEDAGQTQSHDENLANQSRSYCMRVSCEHNTFLSCLLQMYL